MGTHLTNPAATAVAVTPHDTNDLAAVIIGGESLKYTASLHISVSGTLKVDTANGDTVTFPVVPVGVLPLQVSRVYATGTDATGIVAYYNPG